MLNALGNAIRIASLTYLVLCTSCTALHRGADFRIIPQQPDYLLQSPDARKTPFAEVLRAYNGYERGQSWVDLRPLMELRIENAYYQPGASRQGLKGFLGTEVARYEVRAKGLRLISVTSMEHRPPRDLPVQQLTAPRAMRWRSYRFYYEVFFPGSKDSHGSVILGADSMAEMQRLSEQMSRPESVCYLGAAHCTVFPQACTVSLEMRVTVNGKSRSANWGSLLGNIRQDLRQVEVKRRYAGRLVPVKINPLDPGDLRLPLLP
jgi:hypothetical protein